MNNDTSKIVGARIRMLRKNNQMSILQLSQQLGISQQHQSRHELGEIRIHVDTLYLIAEILELEIEALICDFIEKNDNHDLLCKQIKSHLLEAELLLPPDNF